MKQVIMLSGGLDSTTLAVKLSKEKKANINLSGIFFDVGQYSASRQEAAVKRLSLKLNMPVEFVDLKGMAKLFLAYYEPPHVMVAEVQPINDDMELDFKKPQENGGSCKVITIAASYAESIGANVLHYGATSNDIDSAPNFKQMLEHISETVKLNSGKLNFSIQTPLDTFGNKDIPLILKDFGFSSEDLFTWSCHWGGLHHCGECFGCKTRKNRFGESGLEDKTIYRSK